MVIMLNREYALEVLREVVEENGADTTAICAYVITKTSAYGQPEMVSECIVGKVLDKLGVPLSKLDEYGDGIAARGMLEMSWMREEYVHADAAAISALQHAQDTQDNHHNWGVALRSAERGVSVLPGEDPDVTFDSLDAWKNISK